MRKATGNGAALFPPETERTLLGARAQVGSTKHPFHSGRGGSNGTPKSLRTPRAPTPVLGFPRPAPSSQGTVSALVLQRRLQTSTLAPNSGTDTVPFTGIFLFPSSSSHSGYCCAAHKLLFRNFPAQRLLLHDPSLLPEFSFPKYAAPPDVQALLVSTHLKCSLIQKRLVHQSLLEAAGKSSPGSAGPSSVIPITSAPLPRHTGQSQVSRWIHCPTRPPRTPRLPVSAPARSFQSFN